MNLAQLVHRHALARPARPAIACGTDLTHDWARFGRRMLNGGATLAAGHEPGERVAIAMKNRPEYWESLFAIWAAGLVAVPINAKLHPAEMSYIVNHAGAATVLADPDIAVELDAQFGPISGADPSPPPEIIAAGQREYEGLFTESAPRSLVAPVAREAEDLAWLFYTSGTTGRPKGAMLSHRNLIVAATNHLHDVDTIGPDDAMIHAAPASHGSGFIGLSHVVVGAVNVFPESGGFEVGETLELIERWPGCTFFFAPTMVHRLISDERTATAATQNLRSICYGGGPMYVEDLLEATTVLGPKLAQIYGMGESPMTITGMRAAEHDDGPHPNRLDRLASAGRVRTGVEVLVVDHRDRPVDVGALGEVVVRGDVVMSGYWQAPDATAEALRSVFEPGGHPDGRPFLHTGDVGSFDEFGFLTLRDRSKDMIISGGTNIYPREIEEVLLQHPAIAEASVVGQPHPDWGEEVVAFVVVDGIAPSHEDLDELCLSRIARFKRPRKYRFVDQLPKNNYGKVLKTDLRALLASETRH